MTDRELAKLFVSVDPEDMLYRMGRYARARARSAGRAGRPLTAKYWRQLAKAFQKSAPWCTAARIRKETALEFEGDFDL